MTKFQFYSHYKLPITTDPLKFGRLLDQINNKFIVQLTTKNVAIIKQSEKENFIRIFKNGDLVLEFRDKITSETSFIRYIYDTRFLFENDKLISTQIFNASGQYIILSENITPLNYTDSNSIQLNYRESSFKWLENTNIYKNKKAELFIIFELFLIFSIYIIFFVIFPETDVSTSLAAFSAKNIVKLRKTKSTNRWNVIEFKINNKVFSKDLLLIKFKLFWSKVVSEFTTNNHMFILFKIKYKNGEFVTIGSLQRLNLNEKDWFFNWIINMMEFKSEYYNETQIESFIFSYGFKKGKANIKEIIKENINYQAYHHLNLPITMNPLDYGKLITKYIMENYTEFILQTKEGYLINFKQFDKYNEITILNKTETMISYKDELISENKFMRILNNKKYLFENNKEMLHMKEYKSKFISKIPFAKNIVNNFLVLDIETYIKDGILIPFCISIYDGKVVNNFYITDYKNSEDLIVTALKSIMIRKYNGYKVYIHNMAKFDIIFLLKYLVMLGIVDPIIHNDRIISVNLSWKSGDNKYQLHFRDSYLILLNSLKKLCESFKVENSKSVFPHLFVNENNFNYEGEVPEFKYFVKTSLGEYENYKGLFHNNWNLQNEVIKYCNLDCISLHQVITKFNNMIFELFKVNIHKYPTLPSLAFAIFRSNFMSEENIPQLSGQIANDIRQSYTGGAVDMYIPENPDGEQVFGYDVNSLYPSQMKTQLMPVGNPTYFYGDIRKMDPNAFGFFYCKIKTPEHLDHPIIQTHVKTENGIRTMAPLGSWEDMIFSPEMDNAMKYGYEFEILWGYIFEAKYVFEEYVTILHGLRKEYPTSHPLNLIAKILLNSLYGRFGMDDNFVNINVIHKDYYSDFQNKYFDFIIDEKEIGDYILVRYMNKNSVIDFSENNSVHNVSVGIAAAITAYSRILMTQFKNNINFKLYYSDTDSAYTNKPLPDNLVDPKILGKLKLEHICNKAIFLAPKVYCLETIDNKFIYKVKGLSHDIPLSKKDYVRLLHENTLLEKFQMKWFRKLDKGHIELIEQIYTLKVTENKRKLIFENGKLVKTTPYIINYKKEILNNLPPLKIKELIN